MAGSRVAALIARHRLAPIVSIQKLTPTFPRSRTTRVAECFDVSKDDATRGMGRTPSLPPNRTTFSRIPRAVPARPRSVLKPRLSHPQRSLLLLRTPPIRISWYHDQMLASTSPMAQALFYYQIPEVKNINGAVPKAGDAQAHRHRRRRGALQDKALYLVRTNPKGVSDKSGERHIQRRDRDV